MVNDFTAAAGYPCFFGTLGTVLLFLLRRCSGIQMIFFMFLLPSYAQNRPSIYEEPFVPFRGRFSVPEGDGRNGHRRRLRKMACRITPRTVPGDAKGKGNKTKNGPACLRRPVRTYMVISEEPIRPGPLRCLDNDKYIRQSDGCPRRWGARRPKTIRDGFPSRRRGR